MEHHHAAPSGLAVLSERSPVARPIEPEVSPRNRQPSQGDAAVWNTLFGGPGLAAADLAELARIAQTRSVEAGQTVLARASPADALVALRSGEVALGFRTADGTFRTERIVRGPAWLDLGSAWLAAPHAMDAQALGASTVIELPRQAVAAALPEHPDLAQRLIQGLAREVQALTANTHELMHKDAPARLAQWLHHRCEPLDGVVGQAVVRLHERKRDVASQLAITPETLSRLMRSFTRQGVIEVSGYSVRVIDPPALERLAQV
ncbi:MAG: Crp/Fnr family transcriptional regulator [Burkholderiaceae bacterium]|nr:Crp/Fnr family transcriptional regulator [Burkholderiaceae bacterium]